MNTQELHILQHSLGLDEHGQGRSYRNHYVVGEGCDGYRDCMALVERGLMTRRAGNEITGGDDCFYVTEAGRAAVSEHSPKPPKRTRSQKRYDDWLAADSSIPFGEWLRRGFYREVHGGAA